jgi:hypothetical protein
MKPSQRITLAVLFTFIALIVGSLFVPEPPKAHAASQFANIVCDQFKPFSSSANVQLATAGNGNMFIYICGYNINNGNAAAQSVSIVEGTGTTCATSTAAVVGNSTAAGGMALGVNGTINYGSGSGAVAKTAVAGDNLCLFTGGGPIAGVIGWTQAPF